MIIGSAEWQVTHAGNDIDEELKNWLRFSLTVKPDMQLVVKRDAHNFDVCDTVLSRCEISLAYQRLPKRWRWALWDRLVKGRELYELAIAYKVKPETVEDYVTQGLKALRGMIYEVNEF